MKPLLLAAAILLAPAAAQAQVAAGTMPNTFDGPRRPVAAAAAPAPTVAPQPIAVPVNPAAEEILRTLIGGAQQGAMDYSLLTDGLAAQIRAQEAVATPVLQGFGDLVSVAFVGSVEQVDIFEVIFANAATEWRIGVNDEGKVSALLFRPAE